MAARTDGQDGLTHGPPSAGGASAVARLAAVAPAERLALLKSAATGLSIIEAERRLRLYGPNLPERATRRRPVLLLLSQFTHTLALLLWLAAGLALAARIVELAGAIVAVIIVNGVFAFAQEYRAEQVVRRLMRSVAVQARVLRNGVERPAPAADLVPGDVVRFSAGDIIPADTALLTADNLSLDLSMITGESTPERRDPAPFAATADTPLADMPSITPAGSAVITGTGEGVVCATGPDSTLGRVAHLVESVQRGRSLLERQIAELSRVTAAAAVIAGASP
ncbi:MAG: cation-transporting P-type ATPase [Dehalococcoidia bacterium]